MKQAILEITKYLGQTIMANSGSIDRFDMSYGFAGFAMFFHSRFLFSGEASDQNNFYDCVDLALACSNQPTGNGFEFIDLTEYSYFITAHQDTLAEKFDTKSLLKSANALLLDFCESAIRGGSIDPYTGGFHQAWYFLLQGKNRKFLEKLVKDLQDGRIDLGLDRDPTTLQLGIGHGLAFYLLFMVKCHESGIAVRACKKMANRIASVILAAQQDLDFSNSLFPDIGQTQGRRVNLCYGDLGIVYALNRAKFIINKIGYLKRLGHMLTSINSPLRPMLPARRNSILYGAAGLYLYNSTITPASNEAAHWWKTAASEMLQPLLEQPSFSFYGNREKANLSLLEGATGPLYLYMSQHNFTKNHLDAITCLA